MLHLGRVPATGVLLGTFLLAASAANFIPTQVASQEPLVSFGSPVTIDRANANQLAFSSDGRLIASASYGGGVRIWESATGRPVRNLAGPGKEVAYLEFTPRGDRLVAGDSGGATKIWDVDSGATVATLTGDRLRPIGLTSEGFLWTVSGSTSHARGIVRIWDATSGALQATLEDRVSSATVGRDRVPITFNRSDVRLRDARTGAVLAKLPLARGMLEEDVTYGSRIGSGLVSLSPDKTLLALSVRDGQSAVMLLSVRRVSDGSVIWERPAENPMGLLEFAADGRVLVEQSASGASNTTKTLRLRDAHSGSEFDPPLLQLGSQMEMASLGPVTLSPAGLIVAAYAKDYRPGRESRESEVSAWSVPGPILKFRVVHNSNVVALAFSSDGSRFATADDEGRVRIWQVPAAAGGPKAIASSPAALAQPASTPRTSEVVAVAVSPDRRTVAAALGTDLSESALLLWDARTGALKKALPIRGWEGPALTSNGLAFSPDGTRIARGGGTRGEHGEIAVFEVGTGREVLRLRRFEEPIQAVAYSPDGRFLAGGVGALLGMVSVWDARTGRHVRDLWKKEMIGTFGGALAFSPDSSTLAVAGGGGVQLFETQTWRPVTALSGLEAIGTSIAFLPDGRSLIASAFDIEGGKPMSLAVWTLPGTKPVRLLTPGSGTGLAVAPDGARVVDASEGRLRVWDTATWESAPMSGPLMGDTVSSAFVDARMLVTTGNDGVIVWDTAAREQAAILTAFNLTETGPIGKDWIAIARNGGYDGSAAAHQYVAWRFGASGDLGRFTRDAARLGTALTPTTSAAPSKAPRDATPPPPPAATTEPPAAAVAPRFPHVKVQLSNLPRSEGLVDVPETSLPPDGRLSLALSPDARTLVYRGRAGGTDQLLASPLADRVEPVPISGTQGGDLPFFSPDGQWIGFFAAKKLKVVRTSGGEPAVLGEAADPRGADWGEDGTIVFCPSPAEGLWQVKAEPGGVATRLTVPREDEAGHQWPLLLPGMGAVLYSSVARRRPESDSATIWRSLTSGEEREVLPWPPSNYRYVAGHLVGGSALGNLHAWEFQLPAARVTGGIASTVAGVRQDAHFYAPFGLSEDGALVAVWASRGQPRRMVWLDRQGHETPLPQSARPFRFPRLSPDGTRVAVLVADEASAQFELGALPSVHSPASPGSGRLFVCQVESDACTEARQGANTPASWGSLPLTYDAPSWAPNGILAADSRAGLAVVAPTLDSVRVYETGRAARQPVWSPDGARLLLHRDGGLVMFDPAARTMTPLNSGQQAARNASFSPDGRYLVFEAGDPALPQLFVWPVDGSSAAVRLGTGRQPVWARNGEIFFLDGTSLSVIKTEVQTGFKALAPERLFERRCDWDFGFDVSADGQRILTFSSPLKLKVVRNWIPVRRRPVR